MQARKIRVLYVIGPMVGGGGERHLIELTRGLSKLRFEPHVAVLNFAGPLFDELKGAVASAHLVPKRGKADLAVIRHLGRLIRDLRPDVVHTYMWTGNLWGRLAALLHHRGALVASEHCPDPWKKPYHWLADRLLYQRTDRMVAVARAIADVYERMAGVPRDKITVIPNGKELPDHPPHKTLARDRLGLPQNRVVASLVGRFSPEKGHRRLLDAARAIAGACPEILFYLPGEGPLRETVRAEAYRQGLERFFVLPGFVRDMPAVYAATDLLLVPSDYEGMSSVILESMGHGIPCVASATGGTPEVVADGVTGLLFPPDNASRFASAVIALVRNAALRDKLGRAARAALQETFHLSRMLREYEAMYIDVLAEKGNR